MSIFRTAKRKISQFFEIDYWYRRRKVSRYWYDEDDNKWHKRDKQSWPYRAQDILASTWGGETDLWYAMLLKLDHMFWNLKKHGNEANYYFYSFDIEKFANDNDKIILAKKVLKSALIDEHTAFASNKFWIGSVKVDKKYSDNEKLDVYLCYYPSTGDLALQIEANEVIPPEQTKSKTYTLSSYIDENGKRQFKHEEAKQYRKKSGRTLETWHLSKDWAEDETLDYALSRIDILMNKRLIERLEDYNAEWSFKSMLDIALGRLDQYCPELSIEEIPSLSRELRQHATGNFVKCQQILHLRRLIKKLLNVDDSKYGCMWVNEPDDGKRLQYMKEAQAQFETDKKLAYQSVMDYMLKHAANWWD